jgi:DNA mismatch repair protein MutS
MTVSLQNQNDVKNIKALHELKEKYPNTLFMFRCDGFYYVYGDDAKVCAAKLGIRLFNMLATYQGSFPYHALDTYLPRLVRAGYRIAITEQQ